MFPVHVYCTERKTEPDEQGANNSILLCTVLVVLLFAFVMFNKNTTVKPP